MTPNPVATPAQIADRILAGEEDALDHATLCHFLSDADVHDLMAAADRLRRAFFDNEVHLCSIVNAKQGGCPEDCGFCSQSKHFTTGIEAERFLTSEEIVAASAKAETQNASALGLVTATRDLKPGSTALKKMVDAVKAVRDAGHTEAHASFGMLKKEAIAELKEAGLTELNHNLETVPGLYPTVRPGARYFHSLRLLQRVKEMDPSMFTKSGIMVGLGEDEQAVRQVMDDMRAANIDFLTIGQYLQPTPKHHRVDRFVTPEEFAAYEKAAFGKGFLMVSATPLTRSSYHAGDDFARLRAARMRKLGQG